jgi:hypothetical protein
MIRSSLASLAAALLAFCSAGCSLTIDPEKYAPADCPAGQKACGYKCVSIADPATGCGESFCTPCPGGAPNAAPACGADATCSFACNPGWGDCSADPGCESRVDSSASCGACGRSCTAPSSCDPVSLVCTPVGAIATEGETKGLAEDPASGWTYALVKPSAESGRLGFVSDLTAATTLSFVSTGLGYVSGLSIYGNGAYFGRSVGASEIGLQPLSPPGALQTFDTISSSPPVVGPALDLVTGPSGTLWIPDVGQPARFTPAELPGTQVAVAPVATAVARELGSIRYYVAGQDGTIWASTIPDSAPSYVQVVTGAGRVGAMAAVDLGGTRLLYWVDADRGDVWRYEAPPADKKERIFRGSGPAQMFIAVDNWTPSQGDAYWTDRAAGTVMAWKSYGGYPRAVHVIGRSPSPGRIMVNAAFVFWADDAEQLLRAVPK